MKQVILFAATAIMMSAGSLIQAHTLTEAIEKALQTNPEILSSNAALMVSEEQLNSARAAYLPTVDLSLTAGDEHMAKPASAVTDMWKQDHSLTLTQKLFDGGTTDSTVERSEEMFKQARIRSDELRGTVTLNVIESWYELYKLQRIAQMTQRNVGQHQQLFAQIQQKVKVGAAGKAELSAAEGPYIAALTAQAANSGQLSDALARYAKVVGERPDGVLPNPEALLADAQLPDSIETAVEQVISVAPAVRTAESNLLAAGADHRGADAGMLPTLDFEFTELLKNDASGTDGTEYGWTALLKMNYNFYRGGADQARKRETAQALVDSREQLALAQRTAEEQIRIAWSALQVSRRILGLNQQKQKSALEALQSTREQFKLGEVEMMAVMGAEDGLFQAQQAVLQERVIGTLARFRLLNQLNLLNISREDGEAASSKGDATESDVTEHSDPESDVTADGLMERVLENTSGLVMQVGERLSRNHKNSNPERINIDQQAEQDSDESLHQPITPVAEKPIKEKASAANVDLLDHLIQQGTGVLRQVEEVLKLDQITSEFSLQSSGWSDEKPTEEMAL